MVSRGGDEFHWRETFFIMFDSRQRPTLARVERALTRLNDKFELTRCMADADGHFESLTLNSPDDNAALEICFESGEAVIQQGTDLAKSLKGEAEPADLAKLIKSDARLDVMHFEHVPEDFADSDDELDEFLDPSCLLMVVEALVRLTGGIPVDPASGAIMP